MKLDAKEIKVLSYIHMRARAGISEIAKATGLKTHTVRYILDDFKRRDFLQPFVLINGRALGFETISIYFSIKKSFTSNKDEILKGITQMSRCAWLSPMVGDYEYAMVVSVGKMDELHDYFSDLTKKFGSFWGNRIFALNKAWYYLGRKFLLDRSFLPKPYSIAGSANGVKIDDVDRGIVVSLLADPLSSEAVLAKKLEISTSTLNYRIQKLEEKGIIGGYIYGVSYSKIDLSSYRILVDFGGMEESLFTKFFDYSSRHPHIASFNVTTGCYDIEMSVEYQRSQDIMLFLNEFNEFFGECSPNIKVLNRMDDLKWVTVGDGALG